MRELYQSDNMPSFEDVERYIGRGVPLWTELLSYIEKRIRCGPK